jgi:nucleoside-diphosphate-sugar epimerase
MKTLNANRTGPLHVLVVGGYGVAGSAVVEAATSASGWHVVTAGRRAAPSNLLDGRSAPSHVRVDLLDAKGTEAAFEGLGKVTRLVFAAYVERESMAANVAPNVELLRNTLNALKRIGARVERVVLLGGGKSYGPHLGPYKTPAKEDDPRIMGPIYYDDQEDLLTDWSAKNAASWTVLRPDGIAGPSFGSPMNLLQAIAVFASVSKQLKVPLRFPGSPAAWSALQQMTDATVLGQAALWALTSDSARNEIFNVTNGDHFRWRHLWPEIGRFFDMPTAEMQPMSVTQQMADKERVWNRIVARHGLVPTPWKDIAAWPFMDGILGLNYDLVQSTIKVRQAGFTECVDTHKGFIHQLQRLRDAKLIP